VWICDRTPQLTSVPSIEPMGHQKRDQLALLESYANKSHNETEIGYTLDTPEETILAATTPVLWFRRRPSE